MEFKYALRPNDPNPILKINRRIGIKDGVGICGKQFSDEIDCIDSLNPSLITIYGNSTGGGVEDGYDMFGAIARCQTRTKGIYQGFAFSSMGWILLACDEVYATDYTQWMCHLARDPNDPTKRSSFLDGVTQSIAIIISQKSGKNGFPKKSVDEILGMLKVETFMSAQELYNSGLIDGIIYSGEIGDRKSFQSAPFANTEDVENSYQFEQKQLDDFIDKNFKQPIKKTEKMAYEVENALGIAENSSEADKLSAIATLKNAKQRAENELKEATNDLDSIKAKKLKNDEDIARLEAENAQLSGTKKAIEDQKLEAENKLEALEKENKDLRQEKLDAENKRIESEKANLELKADNFLSNITATGRIPDVENTISKWKVALMKDFETTSLLLESLPVNMHIPTPTIIEGSENKINVYEEGTMEWFKANAENLYKD